MEWLLDYDIKRSFLARYHEPKDMLSSSVLLCVNGFVQSGKHTSQR